MRILVTGHLGYVGTILTPLLHARGHEVTGWDSDLFTACTYDSLPPAVPSRKADIRDITAADLNGFDAVVHLAGLSNDPLGDLDPALTREINYAATVRLGRLAREAGVARFVFASTCSVYGAAGEDVVDETAECRPMTPYAESKLQAEQELAALAGDSFSPTFMRPATAYGVSPRLRFDLVVNNLTAWAFTTGHVHLKSDGMAWRPLVHVADLAQASAAALAAPRGKVHNQIFNVGATDANYRIRDVAEIVAAEVPQARIRSEPGAGADARSYRVNCDKIAEMLPDFQPRWTVETGVRQLVQSYRDSGLTLSEFEGARYQRLAHIQALQATGRLDADLRWVQ